MNIQFRLIQKLYLITIMRLQNLLRANTQLLTNNIRSHSRKDLFNLVTQAICRQHLFDQKTDLLPLIGILRGGLSKNLANNIFLDWFNVFLFNVCALNEQLITQFDNEYLQSTEDAPGLVNKKEKGQFPAGQGRIVRNRLKKWLSEIINLQSLTKLMSTSITKSKSFRYLLETLDYLILKYQINCDYKDKIIQIISNTSNVQGSSLIFERVKITNKRLFKEGELLVEFIEEVTGNYNINISEIAEAISANYFHLTPSRKIFQTADATGMKVTESLIDFVIKKFNKSELFSQKSQEYRPFELLMNIIFQKQGSILLEFMLLIKNVISSKKTSLYQPQNYSCIKSFSNLLASAIPQDYPNFHRILKYIYSSLLEKYTAVDSLELIKKFILNRLFLNPFYFALIMAPSESEMECFVKVANEFRVLFYEKKAQNISLTLQNAKLIQFGELVRSSLQSMLHLKQNRERNIFIKDKGIYINDNIISDLLCNISDNLKNDKHVNIKVNENHSQSSLSFSLRNDSMSKGHIGTTNIILPSNKSISVPQLPKPRLPSQINNQSATNKESQVFSTDTYLGGQLLQQRVDKLEYLVSLRREYGSLRREVDLRCEKKQQRRQSWHVQFLLINDQLTERRKQVSKTSNELLRYSLLF